ncbi:MAG TPA: response regulator [Caulobacteraceae bacterium]|jgi:DNA-binding NtrC family response regulator
MTDDDEEMPLSGIKVLVVEDQFLIADDIQRAVGALGGDVIGPFPNIDRARAALAEENVGLALLDVNLGGADRVFPLADELAARHVPFIFSTGYDRWVLPPAHQNRPRLEKPVTPGALREAAVKALADGAAQ